MLVVYSFDGSLLFWPCHDNAVKIDVYRRTWKEYLLNCRYLKKKKTVLITYKPKIIIYVSLIISLLHSICINGVSINRSLCLSHSLSHDNHKFAQATSYKWSLHKITITFLVNANIRFTMAVNIAEFADTNCIDKPLFAKTIILTVQYPDRSTQWSKTYAWSQVTSQ